MNNELCPKCNQNAAGIYTKDAIPYDMLERRIPLYLVNDIKKYVDSSREAINFFICSACGYIEAL